MIWSFPIKLISTILFIPFILGFNLVDFFKVSPSLIFFRSPREKPIDPLGIGFVIGAFLKGVVFRGDSAGQIDQGEIH